MNIGDAVSVAPHVHEVLEENERVRVLEVTVPPGAVAQMHTHPPNISVVLQGGSLIFTNEKGDEREVTLAQHSVVYSDSSTHKVENTSELTVRVIQIELK